MFGVSFSNILQCWPNTGKFVEKQTLVQKIIAEKSNKKEVNVGEIVMASVDRAMGHDITGPAAAALLRDAGINQVWDKDKVVLVADHFVPAKDPHLKTFMS